MAQTKMKIEDWLDDLCVRFLINLPQEELSSVERICFQVEEAQWFYEDFVRPLDPTLPSMSLRSFCLRIFQHCPLFSAFTQDQHLTAFSEFLAYKTRVPVRGAILLNDAMDQVVLVKGWKKTASWSFPRGKINKDEKDLDCALREVYEETGFDIGKAGLVTEDSEASCIESTMREQNIRMYVFRGVPMDTHFEAKTRGEISEIAWHRLSDLPTLKKVKTQAQRDQEGDPVKSSKNYYMVAPFLAPLKKWITAQKKADASGANLAVSAVTPVAESLQVAEPPSKIGGPSAASITILTKDKMPGAQEHVKENATSEQMSMELKRLLSIQDRPPAAQAPAVEPVAVPPSNQDKSMALLALLRNNANGSKNQQKQNVKPPPSLPIHPASSHPSLQLASGISPHHTPDPLQSLNARPPPVVPVPSSHFASVSQNIPMPQHQPGYPFPAPSSIPAPSMPQRYQHPQHIPGGVAQPGFDGAQVHSPVVHQSLAAYPRNGQDKSPPTQENPIKSNPPQFTTIHSPTIPTPSQLPQPKLTSHSLQLLNVLKNGPKQKTIERNISEVALNGSVAGDDSDFQPSLPTSKDGHPVTQTLGPSRGSLLAGIPVPPVAPKTKPDTIGNTSAEHRQTLLSIFRTPSVTPGETPGASAPEAPLGKIQAAAPSSAVPPPTTLPLAPVESAPAGSGTNGQAPSAPSTSHAHKEFLLGYLDAVANSSKAK